MLILLIVLLFINMFKIRCSGCYFASNCESNKTNYLWHANFYLAKHYRIFKDLLLKMHGNFWLNFLKYQILMKNPSIKTSVNMLFRELVDIALLKVITSEVVYSIRLIWLATRRIHVLL